MTDAPPARHGRDPLLHEAHRFLDWTRERTDRLDDTDESIWFLQGVLESMAGDTEEDPAFRDLKCFAYAVYVAEMLARSCTGVEVVVDAEGMGVREVLAVGRARLFVLSWVRQCLHDPEADNIVFKYAGGLRDLGEPERAGVLSRQLAEYRQFMADPPEA